MIIDPIGPLNPGESNCVRIVANVHEINEVLDGIKILFSGCRMLPASIVELRDNLRRALAASGERE